MTREERVFFPVERTGPPGGGRPAATPDHFPSRRSRPGASQPQIQILYSHCTIVFVVHAQRFKSAHGPCSSPFRTRRIRRSSHERDPASLHHPPGGTRVHHRPSPLRGERAARASASRFILLNPPPGLPVVHQPARIRSLAPPCDRLLHSSILAPRSARKRFRRLFSLPSKHVRPGRGPRLFVCCPARCLPPVTLCQQSAASFGRRRLSSNALCRLAPRPVIGRPPHIAAGRPPPGGPVRSTPERTKQCNI